MDQARLREYENKCVQEEPPFCQAACPLHVEGRALCTEVKGGRIDEAVKTLLRVLPLPHIMTRLCEEPCKAACKRKDLGGSIEMRALERHCVEQGAPPKPAFIPSGGKKIAVIGSALSSLVAAWDLARKGHIVTVFHGEPLGGELAERFPEDFEAEFEALRKMKVSFTTELPPDILNIFDRLYIGLDDLQMGFPRAQGPWAGYGAEPHVFSDGQAATCIERAFQGRKAALSIVRDMQGASLSASREREGAFETRLFTNLTGVEPVHPSPDPVSEAARCLDCQCLECVKACGYLRAYKGYPKRYAREIYNNLSVVQGSRTANKMINSCTNCGLCASVCPNGFDMGALCAEARTEMTRQGKMPPSAHEFALLDMEHSCQNSFMLSPILFPANQQAANGGGNFVTVDSATANGSRGHAPWFFPGCQLWASDPGLVKRVYGFLRDELGAGLWLDCCGAPAKWAGRDDLFGEQKRTLMERWAADGSGVLIAACSSCLAVFREYMPNLKAVSLWDVLNEAPSLKQKALLKGLGPLRIPFEAALYLPCTVHGEEKALLTLAGTAGIKTGDQRHGECCGYGGLQACANPNLADETTRRIADGINSDVVTACAVCRDRFASVGKRSAHLLDLLFPAEDDPFSRAAPRLSERRGNRERLAAELLSELGGEAMNKSDMNKSETEPAERGFILEFEPGVREKLNSRRILDEDILRVVRRAEETGRKMTSPEGRNVAYLKPRNVTTWVEYTIEERPDGTACRVSGAWSHRMTVPGSEAR